MLQTDSVVAQAVFAKAEGEKGGRRCSAVVMTTWGVAWQEGVIAVATRQQAVH